MVEIWRNEQEWYMIESIAISGDFLYSRKFAAPFAAKQWWSLTVLFSSWGKYHEDEIARRKEHLKAGEIEGWGWVTNMTLAYYGGVYKILEVRKIGY